MLVTTTTSIEGISIEKYLGVVTGETIPWDISTGIINAVHAPISSQKKLDEARRSYMEQLREARDSALSEMMQSAQQMGANAVIGVDIDYETVGPNGGMLMVSATGTAVVLR
ncbi:MAG TPA: YbjQ family protein [Aggregatilineales bacterium]|nr:YbjQ family protein [Aggregatilineales bacterium]